MIIYGRHYSKLYIISWLSCGNIVWYPYLSDKPHIASAEPCCMSGDTVSQKASASWKFQITGQDLVSQAQGTEWNSTTVSQRSDANVYAFCFQLHSLPVRFKSMYQILFHTFKVLCRTAPLYLSDLIQRCMMVSETWHHKSCNEHFTGHVQYLTILLFIYFNTFTD